MKQYVILGSNNFWYSYFEAETEKEIQNEIDTVLENMRLNQYDISYAYETIPENLRVMEVNIFKTIQYYYLFKSLKCKDVKLVFNNEIWSCYDAYEISDNVLIANPIYDEIVQECRIKRYNIVETLGAESEN